MSGSAPAIGPTLLRQPRFLRVCLSRTCSGIAFQMLSVAIGWQLYELTRNPFDLGLIGLVQFVPMFFASPFAGFVADAFERRRVVAICQGLAATCALVLALGVTGGWLDRWAIFSVVGCLGAVRAFEFPTMSSLVPLLVERALLTRAVSLYSSANQTAVVLGPAIGGALTAVNPGLGYAVAGALFGLAAVLMMTLGETGQAREKAHFSVDTLTAGLRFIGRSPDLLGAMTLDLMAVGLGSVTAVLPAFARDVLHAGPAALGLLRAAPAVGALSMALVLARFPIRGGAGAKMFGGVTLYGLGTIAFGLSDAFPLALTALVVMGLADVLSVVVRQSLVQLRTPDGMRGRVGAVNSMGISASNQLGEFRAGTMASLVGIEAAIVLGGFSSLGVVAVWLGLFPRLRRLERLED